MYCRGKCSKGYGSSVYSSSGYPESPSKYSFTESKSYIPKSSKPILVDLRKLQI